MSRLEEVLALRDLRQCILVLMGSPDDLRCLGMASHSTSAACLAYLRGNKQAGEQLIDTAVCSCVDAFQRCTEESHCAERRLEHLVDSVRWLQGVCDRGLVLRAQHVAALRPVLLWYSRFGDFQPGNDFGEALLDWCETSSRPRSDIWVSSAYPFSFWPTLPTVPRYVLLRTSQLDDKQNMVEVLDGLHAECRHDGVLQALSGRAALRRDLHAQQNQQQRSQQRQQLLSKSKRKGLRQCKPLHHKQ